MSFHNNIKKIIKKFIFQIKFYTKKIISWAITLVLGITPHDLFNDSNNLYKLTTKYIKFKNRFSFINEETALGCYIDYLQINILSDNKNLNIIKDYWLNLLKNENDDVRMMICILCFHSRFIDNDISSAIMSFALQTRNKSYRYWVTMDISKKLFACAKGFYPDFYNDRKNLLKTIATENKLKIPPQKNSSLNSNKLCVIVYTIAPSLKHGVLRVSKMITDGIGNNFDSICIINLDTFAISKSEKTRLTTTTPVKSMKTINSEIEKFYNNKTNVLYCEGETYKERMQSCLDLIFNINPTVILDISDEYSPTSYYYSKYFKTFYLPMRNRISSSFYNYILGPLSGCKKCNTVFNNSIDLNRVKNWILPEYVPPKTNHFTREQLKLPKDKFIVLSIGNNQSYPANFIDEMINIMNIDFGIIWLLVGSNISAYIRDKGKSLICDKRIIEHGYENNLASLCACCDVVLRSNQTGGSGGSAIAAQQGLPIVLTNFECDAMRWLGDDYTTIDNYNDLMQEILKLKNDKEYYKQRQEITKRKIDFATDADSKWRELANILLKK